MPEASARVYECYVRRCYPKQFTVDVQSRQGRNFKRVSYLLPYIRLTGTGINFVPELGAECLVVEGAHGLQLVLGFRMPFSAEQSDREDLPPGSIDLCVVSEDGVPARVQLVKGGTVLVQSKNGCRTLYSPSDSSIVHVFSSWEMRGPNGHVLWRRKPGEQHATYEAEYRTKSSRDEPGWRVKIEINDETPMRIRVDRGDDDPAPPVDIAVRSDGAVEAVVNRLALRVLGELDIIGSDFKVNKRAILPQGDPI